MNDVALRKFVDRVMGVSNGFIGFGNASAGILGATPANDDAVNNLRKSTLAFAAEYSKHNPDREKLVSLSEQVEGSLDAVKLFYGLSDNTLDELLTELESLMAAVLPK